MLEGEISGLAEVGGLHERWLSQQDVRKCINGALSSISMMPSTLPSHSISKKQVGFDGFGGPQCPSLAWYYGENISCSEAGVGLLLGRLSF